MKLYSALFQQDSDPFGDLFNSVISCAEVGQMKADGALLLHGGADINPNIYGQKPNSYVGHVDHSRDKRELEFVFKAKKLGMPIIGICRGAQLLCALSGGSLFQHVTGHGSRHRLFDADGEAPYTNSIHHQMMNIGDTEHELIAWALHESDVYVGENDELMEQPEVEPEIVYFPEWKGLAIQGHPEYLTPQHEFVKYCKGKVISYVL